jgi:pimeloyl-ACP methyl ester carboxylesterase
VIALDLRGHGESSSGATQDDPSQAFTMEMLADDCAAFLDALGIRQPAVIGGLSMGGYVALAFARKYPQRLAGLILAATRAGVDSEEGKANRDKAIALAQQSGSAAIAESMLPKMMSPDTYLTHTGLVKRVHEMMKATPVSTIMSDLMGMKERPNSTPFLTEIRTPTLLLCGAGDQIIPQAEMESMAASIPGAQIFIIPRAGHLLNLEQPEEFNESVLTFLSQIPNNG